MKHLTDNEAKAIAKIIANLNVREGEDTIGVLMKEGCFKILPDNQLVCLAEKLDSWLE